MSYDKQNWQTGDVITANKLNHIEDGIAGGGVLPLEVTVEGDIATLNHTWQEIYDAPLAVCKQYGEGEAYVNAIAYDVTKVSDSVYQVSFYFEMGGDATVFEATSADGYPSVTW